MIRQNNAQPVYIIAEKIVSFEKDGDGALVLLSYGKGLGYQVTSTPEEIQGMLDADKVTNAGGGDSGSWG